jgi:hypothetical protein
MRSLRSVVWLCPFALILASCSESPRPAEEKPAPKAPIALTGRQAFQQIYPQARGWAPDAQPIEIRSVSLGQVKAEPGKAGGWQVIFVSPSRGKAKTYTYSAIEDGDLHQGVFGNIEEGYTPRSDEVPFLVAAIRVDSDEAYKTAAEKSVEYLKKNPNQPVMFVMAQTRRFPDVTWRVIWGNSVATSDYSAYVDGTTGKLLQIMH